MLLFISALHIPLPNEISDRKKVQIFEFILRLGNEYLVKYFDTNFINVKLFYKKNI